ncbi:MAG: PA14 domain-containing protein [Marinobacter sp.]|uniref:PA14 domain-containing protein n=1 Tax=Marinobacter sp. TaxID=50741 RepID=UPI00299F2AFE|nr:PA14 domain-containing protein [Marinobacter sp.]MDX1754893.1 PA14 domain-containing protein [Marinobacter sp.]
MYSAKLLVLTSAITVFAGCQSWQYGDLGDLDAPAALPETSEPGKVQAWFYDGISGIKVSDLTSASAYPDSPTEIADFTSLHQSARRGDDYGTFIRGYIEPPVDGSYRFFTSGDDETQFWLSTSTSPDDKALVATVPGYSSDLEYTKYSSQTSAYLSLSAGQRYYFEVLHKEGSYGDHFSVAWEGPGISQQVIDGPYLHSYAESQIGDLESTQEAYSLGYRVGFVDGTEGLAFTPSFPPLDQDQDGIYDNWEVVNGLDPTNSGDATSDPDGDFLSAADEFLIGTRENNADSDNDGIPDGTEFAYQMDPLDPSDASGDIDSDGYTNLEEYQAGTELDNPESFPEEEQAQYVQAFVGQYFDDMGFGSLYGTRTGESVNFDWSRSAPLSGMQQDRFSVRWSGFFVPPHSSGNQTYDFTITTDDGMRLMLDSATVIDAWVDQAPTSYSYQTSLAAGSMVPIVVEYYENKYGAVAQLAITNTSTGEVVSHDIGIQSPDLSGTSSADTDADGIPDIWELSYGLNAFVHDAGEVNNTSGVTNLEAYESGLHPYTLEPVGDDTSGGDTGTGGTSGSITLTWTAPSTRVDGSSLSLSEIASYEIHYGQSSSNLDQSITVDGAEDTYQFTGLASGTWYFSVTTFDTDGLASEPSEVIAGSVK